jgi:predicted RNase H-like HicB family nuclease
MEGNCCSASSESGSHCPTIWRAGLTFHGSVQLCTAHVPPVLKDGWKTMTQAYKVVIECDTQGLYVATFPELVGCQAQAGSLTMLMERIREALALCPEVAQPLATRHAAVPLEKPSARDDV